MRKVGLGIIVCMVSVCFLFNSSVFAVQVTLTLESYPPATLPTVSKIIDVPDPNDQLEISRQAMLLALSSEGWGLENYGGVIRYNEPPSNLGHLYSIVELIDVSEILGFELNAEAIQYGLSMSGVEFHTDELVGRLSHDFCESADNYGVISGIMGGIWQQCAVSDWGGFRVTPITTDTLFEETFDGGELPTTLTYMSNPDFNSWYIDSSNRLYGDRLQTSNLVFAVLSTSGFTLNDDGLLYSADMGRPTVSVNPEINTTPGGSNIGLIFGGYRIMFHPGYPKDTDGASGAFRIEEWHPSGEIITLVNNTDMGFIPSLDYLHHIEVFVTMQEGGINMDISINGLGNDSLMHTFNYSYSSANSNFGDGKIGVSIQGGNNDDAFFDNLMIEGTAEPIPDISVSPTSYNYGNVEVLTTSPSQTFTVTNVGDTDLVLDTIGLTGADASEFYFQNDICSAQIIAPSGNCTIAVTFSPTSEGAKSATLSIPSNDPDTPVLNVQLSGIGIDPDNVDDDGDGYTENQGDCDDNDTTVNPEAPETPYNGKDDDCDPNTPDDDLDGDGYGIVSDCDDDDPDINPDACDIKGDGIDQDCDGGDRTRGKPCSSSGGGKKKKERNCTDGIDNDGDGLIDCDDRDCRKDPACADGGSNKEICDDGVDNDGDGKIDCAGKKDCRNDPACSG